MIGSVFFIFNRLVEIVFLIPIIGMLVRSISPNQHTLEPPLTTPGILRRRLPKSKPANPTLHPGSIHRQHNRHILGRGHPNPLLNNQTLSHLRRLRGPPLLRRLHRSRLPTALHSERRLRQLARGLSLGLPGPIRILRRTHQPLTGCQQDMRDAEGVVRAGNHGDGLLFLDGLSGAVFASFAS